MHTTVSTEDRAINPADQVRAAQDALTRWEALIGGRGTDSPFLIATDPTTVVGDLSGADAAGFKEALLAGEVEAGTPLPTAIPQDATVRWPGGGSASAPMISAADALKALQVSTSKPCSDCARPAALKVSGAKPGVAHLASSRGAVEVPTWVFAIEGRRQEIAYVAVVQSTPLFVSLESGPYRGDYQPTVTASIAADDRTLTVTGGARPVGVSGPCDKPLTGQVFESAHAVSFTAVAASGSGPGSGCELDARPVTVTLGTPLGTRILLYYGMPIAVTRDGR